MTDDDTTNGETVDDLFDLGLYEVAINNMLDLLTANAHGRAQPRHLFVNGEFFHWAEQGRVQMFENANRRRQYTEDFQATMRAWKAAPLGSPLEIRQPPATDGPDAWEHARMAMDVFWAGTGGTLFVDNGGGGGSQVASRAFYLQNLHDPKSAACMDMSVGTEIGPPLIGGA